MPYMPKSQLEWFAIIIKNQVKRALPEFLKEHQRELENNFDRKLESLQAENTKVGEEVSTCTEATEAHFSSETEVH